MIDIAPMTTKSGCFGYESAGEQDYTALIFLHGIGGAARGWRDQLRFFGGRFRAIAWDMPGYGASEPLETVSITALAAALRAFLDELDIQSAIFVGHSIGGMIVQQLLVDDATRVVAAVLAQTSPAFGRPDGDWQKAFIDARIGPLDRGETMVSLAPTLVAELVGDHPDPDGVALARDCMAAVSGDSYRASMHALVGFDLGDRLAVISVPTLVLSGEKDGNAPAPMMARMAAQIPGASYVELPGVGHLANLEQPAAFNDALDRFLSARIPQPTEHQS